MTEYLYRVVRKNADGDWVPVRSYKAGARETVYGDFNTAARAAAGFRGSRGHRGPYRVQKTYTQWEQAGV
jgi:hypothetical protein